MRARARPILLGLLLFLGGAACALLAEHLLILHHRAAEHGAAQAATTISHRTLLAELDSTLHLTSAQADSIAVIFHRHQPIVDSAWRSINQRLGAAMDTVHRQVEAVLDSSQTATFRGWLRHQHQLPPAGATPH